jgi:hypothetical protein
MKSDRNGMLVLSEEECLRRLGTTGIGRVAVTVGALPAVFPVAYAARDGGIYFRTAPGSKLAAAARNAVVAFEIDQIDRQSHAGWSVMVVGPAARIDDPAELERLAGLPLTRWIDGGPESLIRVAASLVSGREITHAATPVGRVEPVALAGTEVAR